MGYTSTRFENGHVLTDDDMNNLALGLEELQDALQDTRGNLNDVLQDMTTNLYDGSVVEGRYLSWGNGSEIANAEWECSGFIEIEPNANYTGVYSNHIVFYDSNKKYIIGYNITKPATSPSNAKYARIDWHLPKFSSSDIVLIKGDAMIDTNGCKYLLKDTAILASAVLGTPSKWAGKTCVTYGDSITAQGNSGSGGYQKYLNQIIGFSKMYNRGVGGQTYKWNTSTFYANADGGYNSRRGQGGVTEAPAGTTEHKGCFCSWDRITTMIPSDIRESIDLFIIMGGTNDHSSVEDVVVDGVLSNEGFVWSKDNTTDIDWVNDSTYYNGGDYDVTTITGAMASAIMKIQTWCPNALIVIASPFSRWDVSKNAQYSNDSGMTLRDVVSIQKQVAEYMSVPFIDVNAMCQVNAFNYSDFVSDGVHPNGNGQKRLARAVCSGINTLEPLIS